MALGRVPPRGGSTVGRQKGSAGHLWPALPCWLVTIYRDRWALVLALARGSGLGRGMKSWSTLCSAGAAVELNLYSSGLDRDFDLPVYQRLTTIIRFSGGHLPALQHSLGGR